jgi:hypothetical protein
MRVLKFIPVDTSIWNPHAIQPYPSSFQLTKLWGNEAKSTGDVMVGECLAGKEWGRIEWGP